MPEKNQYRTHSCGELRLTDKNVQVTLVGFVDGSMMEGKALDVRDRSGATSILMPELPSEKLSQVWHEVTPESVVQVTGKVMQRKKRDMDMRTGEILVMIEDLKILSPSEVLPQELKVNAMGEEDRFAYRQLHLRRLPMQGRLEFRSKFALETRKALAGQGFLEVETPLLGPFTPDAPGQFVVPMGKGKGYALSSTPQAYKQVLMAGGIEKYFQIARCFRNEEGTTSDRQPEFSVIDLEMAWVEEKDVLDAADKLLKDLFSNVLGRELKDPPPRIPYAQAMLKYGVDKPDLRAGLEMEDVTVTARAFSSGEATDAMGAEGGARLIRIPGGVERLGDGELDEVCLDIERKKLGRCSWLKHGAQTGVRGPAQRLFADRAAEILKVSKAGTGDALLFVLARSQGQAQRGAGTLRKELVRRLSSGMDAGFALCWITEVPFFAQDEENGPWVAKRHPFSQPLAQDLDFVEKEKNRVRTRSFNLVLNGVELGAGGLRNHDFEIQRRIFAMLGYSEADVQRRWGKILESFRFGIPPHGGLTINLDRTVAMLSGVDSIDEVMAFPKYGTGKDLVFDTPSVVDVDLVRALLD
jgi:aspartyl-tRNA synthetase